MANIQLYPNSASLGYTNGRYWTVWGKGLNPLLVFGFFLILSHSQDWNVYLLIRALFVHGSSEVSRESTFLKQDLPELRIGAENQRGPVAC